MKTKISERAVTMIWSVCLIIMGVSGLINSVSSIAEIALPDAARRIIGIMSMAALAAFGFTTVNLYIIKKSKTKEGGQNENEDK